MSKRLAPILACLAGSALAALCSAQGNVRPGRFSEQRLRMPPGLGPAGPSTMADLNGDGLLDIVRTSGLRIDVLLQSHEGRFLRMAAPVLVADVGALEITAIATGRIDGDATVDIIVGLAGADELVLSGSGTGTFIPAPLNPIPPLGPLQTAPSQILVGDFDQQLGTDILILSRVGSTRLLFGSGGPMLAPAPIAQLPVGVQANQRAGAIADLDGDGDLDLVLSSVSQGLTRVLENVGGVFSVRHVEPFAAAIVLPGEFVGTAATDVMLFRHVSQVAAPPRLLEATGPMQFSGRGVPNLPAAIVLRDAVTGDFDAIPTTDVVALFPDGEVASFFNVSSIRVDLPTDTHVHLAAGDLEGDGDDDLVVFGQRPPDRILLGNGMGSFVQTERPPVASSPLGGPQLGVAIGRPRIDDPELLIYGPAGATTYFDNLEGTRFVPHPSATAPSFGTATFEFVARVTSAIGTEDSFALLDPSQPDGLRFVTQQADDVVRDSTANLWNPTGEWFVAMSSGVFGGSVAANSPRDLVFVDAFGQLRLYRFSGGTYSEIGGAFPATSIVGPTRILVARVAGDPLMDVCVLHTAGFAMFRGTSAIMGFPLFQRVTSPAVPSIGRLLDGAFADTDDDGDLDLVLLSPSPLSSNEVTVLHGDGFGRFVDATVSDLPADARATIASRLLVVGNGRRQVLVLGLPNGRILLSTRRGAGAPAGPVFGALRELPLHGSGALADLLAADFDADLDQDLVVLRDGTAPQVLFNRDLHLATLAVAQIGRSFVIRMDADPGDLVALLLGFVPTRILAEPFGVLRLADAVSLATFAVGVTGTLELALPLDSSLPEFNLTLQLAAVRLGGPVPVGVLGNLQRMAISSH